MPEQLNVEEEYAAHYHPDDKLHVVLDALAFARGEIEGNDKNGAASRWYPWEDYGAPDPDAPDVKSTRRGWLETLTRAEVDIRRKLDTGAPL